MKNLRVTESWLQTIVEYINYNLYKDIEGKFFHNGYSQPFFEGQYVLDRSTKGYTLYKRDANKKANPVGGWSDMTQREAYCVLQGMQQGMRAQALTQESATV